MQFFSTRKCKCPAMYGEKAKHLVECQHLSCVSMLPPAAPRRLKPGKCKRSFAAVEKHQNILHGIGKCPQKSLHCWVNWLKIGPLLEKKLYVLG